MFTKTYRDCIVHKRLSICIAFVIITVLGGCNYSHIKDITRPLETASTDSFSDGCDATFKASSDANQSVTLKSSIDQTYFFVDGKKINEKPAKLLKVCINNKREHTIVAQPIDCKKKMEVLEPPYNNTFLEFQFMMGECHLSNNQDDPTSNINSNCDDTHDILKYHGLVPFKRDDKLCIDFDKPIIITYHDTLPQFPFPPPMASSTMVVKMDEFLNEYFSNNIYHEFSYYSVLDGFALVTQLEQIDENGSPKTGESRWQAVPTKFGKFSLGEYIKTLLYGKPGFFRVIVFIISPHSFTQTAIKLSKAQASDWIRNGSNSLPTEIREHQYYNDY